MLTNHTRSFPTTESFHDILKHLRRELTKAGKRVYEFVVGKITIPKLANFPEMDAFVLLGCPETTIIDSKEHLRPVVTPYEALFAIGPDENAWTAGSYRFHVEGLLSLHSSEDSMDDTQLNNVDIGNNGAMVTSSAALERVMQGASTHLVTRTFQGLDLTEPAAPSFVQAGQIGIASSYKVADV